VKSVFLKKNMTQRADTSTEPALIGLDWGTSALRAYLLAGDGNVIERRSRPWGIQHLPAGGYAEAFETVAGDWRAR
jgi:2-dehydro-3-deoxygalactonokinase